VVTTGATVEACARILRQQLGARNVRVLTLARVARSRST
jgi:predicted amidophosphoribosyltransferase